MTTPLLRRAGAAASALAVSLVLVACGGNTNTSAPSATSTPSTPSEAAAPTEDDLAAALLTADDVPDGYTEAAPDESDNSTVFDGTCLADVADFKEQVGSDPVSEAKTEFTTQDASGQAQISSGISVYDDQAAVDAAFGAFYDSVKDCTNLSFTDDNGVAYEITVAIDDTVSLDGADQQLGINLDGTVTVGEQMLPIAFVFLLAQEGAATSAVGTSEIGGSYGINDEVETLAQTQADRLADVLS